METLFKSLLLSGDLIVRFLAFGFVLCSCIPAAKADSFHPSKDTIQIWWNSKSKEEMKIEGDLIEIRLRNQEIAYLAPVGFYHRGRNFIWHTVLVRPALQEVREIGDPVRRDIEVYDVNHDGVSEVVAVSLGSGQGTTIGRKSIVQFDGWKPIVLHHVGFEDNEGAYGVNSHRFFSRTVSWTFADLDKDGNSDLVEEITIKEGRNSSSPITTKNRFKYVFKNNTFIRHSDYKRSTKGNQ